MQAYTNEEVSLVYVKQLKYSLACHKCQMLTMIIIIVTVSENTIMIRIKDIWNVIILIILAEKYDKICDFVY